MSGVKIPFGYDSNRNQVTILNYLPFGRPDPIFCGGKGCEAELEYVSASQRVGKSKTTQVPAYFRLAKYENHAVTCSFATKGKQVIDAAGSTNEVLTALANGSRVFRIHLMDDKDQVRMKGKENDFLKNHTHDTVKRTYRVRGRKLPYVNNLNGLFDLYEYGRKNPTMRQSIFVMVDKEKLRWDEFFFDVKHYDELHQKILASGTVKAAVIGHVNKVNFISSTRPFSSAELSPKLQGKGNNIYPIARLKFGLSHRFINPGTKVLCFGSFKLEHDVSKRIVPSNRGHELVMGLAAPYQWLEI
ncbi:hypothetical protein [Vibrio furnissii]|uniref:hypothetical protein n=2 Tax=Vibrio TaxID=662 RepID=UPI001C9D56DD|nr:hypothetical protein [Vibrio furnissii]MBY8067936.1 hypothetical protein [Vibrio fluvialis]WJG23729.1 hypothetical protein QSU95_22250 [Vibrio furnissii]